MSTARRSALINALREFHSREEGELAITKLLAVIGPLSIAGIVLLVLFWSSLAPWVHILLFVWVGISVAGGLLLGLTTRHAEKRREAHR